MLSWITNLKITVKIGATIAVIVLVAAVVSTLSLHNLTKIEDANYWTDHTYKVLGEVSLLTSTMVDQETGVRGYLVSGDTGFLAPYANGQKAFATALENVRTLTADNAEQQERLAAIEGFARQWREGVAEKEIALMGMPSRQDDARRLAAAGAGKAVMDALRAKAREIVADEASLLGVRSTAAAAAGSVSRVANWIGLGAIVLVSAVGLLLLQVGIARPITGMTTMMGRLAQGDVTRAVPGAGRRDEVGAMASAVGVFKDGMIRTRQLETETELARAGAERQRRAAMREMADSFEAAVGGIVVQVSSSATQLQATARTMTSTAGETAAQSIAVAAAAEEAAANVNTVSVAAEELGASVQEITRQVQGSASLAQDAMSEADQTVRLVQALSQAAAKIDDVVGLISGIAGQTNLLALNATIEAARAGEAGRGFAVVATEVKELASQTARATQDIAGQIAQIQAATGQAVAAIGAITGRIRDINTMATTMAVAVEEQGAATQEIVRNVAQASAGTSEVTTNIAGVAGAAEETGAAASQVLASASELSRQSDHLGMEVNRFLATVRAA